ncbi:UPF0481 protein At3g47200-like [Lycium ferocissimum]|uniref:UPF0481 protein At3g47200-like n=1 Tax=Lycium ferocissimum TaxID=112874 RepID=UPI00281508B9|nr:UPF0481 protein At3g47200-like [Lycium ferocissimum]
MKSAKWVSTPLPGHLKLNKEMCPTTTEEKERMAKIPYSSAVRSLMYAMGKSIGKSEVDTRVSKRNLDECLCFGGSNPILKGYTDSDIAGDLDNRKSTTGYLFTFSKGAISWPSLIETKDQRETAKLKSSNNFAESTYLVSHYAKTCNLIEEGGKMDHVIETNQILNEIVTDLYNSSIKSCTIFKVTVGLSASNPNAYKPQLVSIGPYHNNNPQLRSMENYKLRYLQRFLRRKAGIDVERCIRELENLKDAALQCYDDIEDLYSDHNSGKFLKILLLDGSFVVEFIRERSGMVPNGENIIIDVGCIYHQVLRDMLLLENQLPFFVLTKLYDMTMDQIPFTRLMKQTFNSSLLKMLPSSFIETEGHDVRNIKHLLQLVHMSCQPSEKKASQTTNPSMEMEYCRKRLCWNPFQRIRLKAMSKYKDHQPWDANMPNATDLHEAGVRFSEAGKIYRRLEEGDLGDNTSLFDIKFGNGMITIPYFEVCDITETILRNLIAYEQLSFDVHPRYFSDFSVFMDYLIDSDKDVSLLRRKGIIKNEIGEDKEVASLFNKIGKGVTVYSDFYYKEECRKLVQHCEKTWNKMKASLIHNYFNSPWAGASTVGAVILLILTAIQTFLAFTGAENITIRNLTFPICIQSAEDFQEHGKYLIQPTEFFSKLS